MGCFGNKLKGERMKLNMTKPLGACLHETLITMVVKADQDGIDLDENGDYHCSLCSESIPLEKLRASTVPKQKRRSKYYMKPIINENRGIFFDWMDADFEIIPNIKEVKPKDCITGQCNPTLKLTNGGD